MLPIAPRLSVRAVSKRLPSRNPRISTRSLFSNHGRSGAQLPTRHGHIGTGVALSLIGGFAAYQLSTQQAIKLDAPSLAEKKKKLSAQHEQVMQFWDRPGVYLWGSNSGRVAAPDSNDNFVKSPTRVKFFDGYILRDLQLSQTMGAAVTENGDILQWGKGYSPDCRAPVVTLPGKNIVKIGLSQDRLVALSNSGEVYSVPFSKEEQELFPKITERGGFPFYATSESEISYRTLKPKDLKGGERVVDIAVGLEHTVMLTSSGRVFTAACASYMFPEKGQLGVPEMSWETKPKPYDRALEVKDLSQFRITQIAAGNYHNVAADKNGNVFTWGDNSKGQLGVEFTNEFEAVPVKVPAKSFYADDTVAKLQKIYAGGSNSYFTMEASIPNIDYRKPATKSYDLFVCGHGLHGTLGTGTWVHAQYLPQKVRAISGLTEYSDKLKQIVPIGFSYITIGAGHAAAIMSTGSSAQASGSGRETDISFGNDIMFFGSNEFFQLGTGKRNNLNVPTNIPSLDPTSDSDGNRIEHRLQVVPSKKVQIVDQDSKKRSVTIEQRVVAGRGLTGCYAKAA